MRQHLSVFCAAIVVLGIYFGYLSLHKSPAHQPQFGKLRMLVKQLEQYRDAKGGYPLQSPTEVSIAELKKALDDSGLAFRSTIDLSDFDPHARYISVDGKAYGILFHFDSGGSVRECILEVHMIASEEWGQPPPCPL